MHDWELRSKKQLATTDDQVGPSLCEWLRVHLGVGRGGASGGLSEQLYQEARPNIRRIGLSHPVLRPCGSLHHLHGRGPSAHGEKRIQGRLGTWTRNIRREHRGSSKK